MGTEFQFCKMERVLEMDVFYSSYTILHFHQHCHEHLFRLSLIPLKNVLQFSGYKFCTSIKFIFILLFFDAIIMELFFKFDFHIFHC